MVKVFESNETRPVNLGYGPPGNTIREVVELIVKYSKNKPEIMWDTSKTSGDKIRVLDVRLAHSIGFDASTNLEKGIKKTIEWYEVNKTKVSGRYNIFNQGNYNE
jgi:GDP-L-fucose synthase